MMFRSRRLLSLAGLAIGTALVTAACSSSAATPTAGSSVLGATAATSLTLGQSSTPIVGAFLTGKDGMTLYVLTQDGPDSSTCSGTCATYWPPLTIAPGGTVTGPAGATGQFGSIHRADGTTQVTYDHMPLYYYSGDSTAGDITGQGVMGVWFVAPVSGTINKANPSESPGSSAAASPAAGASTAASSGY